MNRRPRYTLDTLADVIAQIVEFARDDFRPEQSSTVFPDEVKWSVSYVVACFIAQHTKNGSDGVETESGLIGLQVEKEMPYPQRLELARALVASFGGVE